MGPSFRNKAEQSQEQSFLTPEECPGTPGGPGGPGILIAVIKKEEGIHT